LILLHFTRLYGGRQESVCMLSQMKRVFSGSGTSFNVSAINIKIARLAR
jgi:hypothetical protein